MKTRWVLMTVAVGTLLCSFGATANAQQLFVVDSAPKAAPLTVHELFLVDQMPDAAPPVRRLESRAPLGSSHLMNLLLAKPMLVSSVANPAARPDRKHSAAAGAVGESLVDLLFAYSYLSNGYGGRAGIHGGKIAATWNAHRDIALGVEVSNYHGSTDSRLAFFGGFQDLDQDMLYVLAGPKFTYRAGNFQMFADVKVGIAHGNTTLTITSEGTSTSRTSDTNFALAAGGGLDYMFCEHFGWRVIQAEFLHSQLRTGGFTGSQAGVQISTGPIWRIGSR